MEKKCLVCEITYQSVNPSYKLCGSVECAKLRLNFCSLNRRRKRSNENTLTFSEYQTYLLEKSKRGLFHNKSFMKKNYHYPNRNKAKRVKDKYKRMQDRINDKYKVYLQRWILIREYDNILKMENAIRR